jgi:ribosomal protein S18 acetylase RimI-like enzyme
MIMNISFRTLENIPIPTLTAAFNSAFNNYFVNIQLTPDQLSAKFKTDGMQLNLSVGAFQDDQLVGFIFHGTNDRTENLIAYNGGTGVVPGYRGLHLPSKMYAFIFPALKRAGVKSIVLEVIEENVKAKNTYTRIGFSINRKVDCYKGSFKTAKTLQDHVVNVHPSFYNKKKVEDLWDIEPTWQNAHLAVERQIEFIDCLTVEKNDKLAGYLLINRINGKILQFAVDRSFRNQGIASALFQKAAEFKEVSVILNVDDRSEATASFLKKHGFEYTLSQYEMKKSIT